MGFSNGESIAYADKNAPITLIHGIRVSSKRGTPKSTIFDHSVFIC
jgi:hypothetical protein